MGKLCQSRCKGGGGGLGSTESPRPTISGHTAHKRVLASTTHPNESRIIIPQVVLFERLVWHLESPAGIVFPKVGGPTGLMRCHASSLWGEFRKHVLHSFNLLNVPPPPVPHVLLSFRRRTAKKNVGRVFQDEKVLTDVLAEGNLIKVTSLDLGSVPFREQLALVRSANVLVGAHGAGLMHVLFMAEEGVLVEIHPS